MGMSSESSRSLSDDISSLPLEKQSIELTGSDELNTFPILAKTVDVTPSRDPENETQIAASSKITITPISKFEWEKKFYVGNLVAVHSSGRIIAYALKGPHGGLVRLVNKDNSAKATIKDLSSRVVDLAFAFRNDVVLAIVDERSQLLVCDVREEENDIKYSILLNIRPDNVGSPIDSQRVAWCPYLQSAENDGLGYDPSLLLLHSANGKIEIYAAGEISKTLGVEPIQRDSIAVGFNHCAAHTQPIMDIAISPDASIFATASADGEVKFYQLEVLETKPLKTYHSWRPHNGKAVSSLQFADDRSDLSKDRMFWKFCITGCDCNREIKIWEVSRWVCLQTLRFLPSPGSSLSEPQLKLALDLSAKYVVLSDVQRRVVYVLTLEETNAALFAKSVTEFLLALPCLSFCILEVGRSQADVDDMDEETPDEHVIQVVSIHTKYIQQMQIRFEEVKHDDRCQSGEEEGLSKRLNGSYGDASALLSVSARDRNGTRVAESGLDVDMMKSSSSSSSFTMVSPMRNEPSTPRTPTSSPVVATSRESKPVDKQTVSMTSSLTLSSASGASSNTVQERKETSAILMTPFEFQTYDDDDQNDQEVQNVLKRTRRESESSSESESESNGEQRQDDVQIESSEPEEAADSSGSYRQQLEQEHASSDSDPDTTVVSERQLTGQGHQGHIPPKLPEPPTEWTKRLNSTETKPAVEPPTPSSLDLILQELQSIRKMQQDEYRKQEQLIQHNYAVMQRKLTSDLSEQFGALHQRLGKLEAFEEKRLSNHTAHHGHNHANDKAVAEALQEVQTQLKNVVQVTLSQHMTALRTDMDKSIGTIKSQLPLSISQLITQRLSPIEQILRDSVTKTLRSKPFIESLGTVTNGAMQTVILDALKEVTRECMAPILTSVASQLHGQLRQLFETGSKEYLKRVEETSERIIHEQNEKKDEMVTHLKDLVETLTITPDEVARETAERVREELRVKLDGLFTNLQDRVKDQLANTTREHLSELRKSLLESPLTATPPGNRARAMTPSIEYQKSHLSTLIRQGQVNAAFKQALHAANLSLVEFVCTQVNPSPTLQQMEQPVLLSLVQQLATDLNSNPELKIKYIKSALPSLDMNHTSTREHIKRVLIDLQHRIDEFVRAHPQDEIGKEMQLVGMAALGFIHNPAL